MTDDNIEGAKQFLSLLNFKGINLNDSTFITGKIHKMIKNHDLAEAVDFYCQEINKNGVKFISDELQSALIDADVS